MEIKKLLPIATIEIVTLTEVYETRQFVGILWGKDYGKLTSLQDMLASLGYAVELKDK